jgi:hypothetical protein
MAQVNFGGLAGVAIGAGCGYALGHYLAISGQDPLQAAAWGSLAGCFAASMFGLLYDRSVVPEFRKSYKTLSRHLIPRERTGPDYDPRERVAVFAIPVAFATMLIPVLILILVMVQWNTARQGRPLLHSADWLPLYLLVGVAGAVLTFVIGQATAEHRLLQREIAFNTAPLVAGDAQPGAVPAAAGRSKAAAKPIAGPPTEAQLAQLRRRGRREAAVCIAGGLLLLAFNHYTATNEHTIYPKAIFGGPMIIMCGIFGLFQPLIMSRHRPVGKYYPRSVLMLTLLAIAIGAAGGWQIYSWYQN